MIDFFFIFGVWRAFINCSNVILRGKLERERKATTTILFEMNPNLSFTYDFCSNFSFFIASKGRTALKQIFSTIPTVSDSFQEKEYNAKTSSGKVFEKNFGCTV